MERFPIVVPVRFATQLTAVQTTTRELSAAGVQVRCLNPPAPGTELTFKLYLPGVREGVLARGVVRETVEEERDSGFWAEFIEILDEDRNRIADMIARRQRASAAKPIGALALQPANDPENDPRRAFPRVNARFAVRFATVQDFVLEYAANISAGGVFVHTEQPPELKAVVRVEMELPGSEMPVLAQGVVVHRVTVEDARKRGTLAGIGVQFVDSDDSFRQKIDAAIDYILKNG